MTRTTYMILLTLFCSLLSCDKSIKNPTTDNTEHNESRDIVKIGDYSLVAKKSFAFISLIDSKDTLYLVTCSDYVYSPFGELTDKKDLANSILGNFTIIDRVDTMDTGEFEFQILSLENSKLIIHFDNDPEASRHSYVFKGEIKDTDVKFINGIKIGMSKDDLLKKFFDYYPEELTAKYKFIVLESCVQDITHTYKFRNNKLEAVDFVTDSYWKVGY